MPLRCKFIALTLILGFCIVVVNDKQVALLSWAHFVLFNVAKVFSSQWLMVQVQGAKWMRSAASWWSSGCI